MVCHGQHTYVYSQVLLQVLSQEPKGGSNMKRLSQEITRCAQQKYAVFLLNVVKYHIPYPNYSYSSYFDGHHSCFIFQRSQIQFF